MSDVKWTPQQAAAIRAEAHSLLVANAGTGKTTTVVGKILWLLGEPFGIDGSTGSPMQAPPPERRAELHQVAAITFTEKAAYDLKRKLREEIERSSRRDELRWELDRASIGTIHSFCGTLLREHALRHGIDPTFRVIDQNEAWAEQDTMIRELIFERLEGGDAAVQEFMKGRKLSGQNFSKGAVDHTRAVMRDVRWHRARYEGWRRGDHLDRDRLAELAGRWSEPDDDSLEATDALVSLALEAVERWEQWLRKENARDFDSLVLNARDLLVGEGQGGAERAAAALQSIRRRYRILVIDEFQDTDFAQRDIAFAIAGIGQKNAADVPQLFLVGDPKQSIYRFRGADIAVWNSVEGSLAEYGEPLALSKNFRCSPPIVDFVNVVGAEALGSTAEALGKETADSRIEYAELEAGREGKAAIQTEDGKLLVEWLVPEGDTADELRASEAAQVVWRIRQLVAGRQKIIDPDTRLPRPCEYSDIALLYRNRTGLEHFEAALSDADVPYWLTGTPHLNERQEILDVLNALKLVRNPRDDVRALGYLRSPFVCLRDEVIARIRMESGSKPLLSAARAALDGEWFEAPEHERLTAIERDALRRGLDTIDTLRALAPRVPLDELVEELLERSGYRLHLVLSDHAEEGLANLQSFIHFCEGYRDKDIGAFIDVWDRWSSQDLGIPQAPLYSRQDQVVTLTTIHAAKGLEWPVVFLIGVEKKRWSEPSGQFVTDRELGPVLCASKDERGTRNQRIVHRDGLEADAEEARLLYVATTRARDRLVIVGKRDEDRSYSEWLEAGVVGAAVAIQSPVLEGSAEILPPKPLPQLAWLDALEPAPTPALVGTLQAPRLRFVVSATELMMRDKAPEAWERRFRHGTLTSWEFAPERTADGTLRLPATVRGTLIHGVLERIQEEEELSMILEETIGSLDDPELAQMLATGSDSREILEQEIRRVVSSAEWAWYTQGEHYRELDFVHLAGEQEWRIGAFDLYRAGDGPDAGSGGAPGQLSLLDDDTQGHALVIDFKTHDIGPEKVPGAAAEYQVQVRIYRAAAECAGPVAVRLHFTGPNVVVTANETNGSRR